MKRTAAYFFKYSATFLPILFFSELIAHYCIETWMTEVSESTASLIDACILLVVCAPSMFYLAVLPLRQALEQEHAVALEREKSISEETRRQNFEAQLHRALELSDHESEVLQIAKRAMDRVDGQPALRAALGRLQPCPSQAGHILQECGERLRLLS